MNETIFENQSLEIQKIIESIIKEPNINAEEKQKLIKELYRKDRIKELYRKDRKNNFIIEQKKEKQEFLEKMKTDFTNYFTNDNNSLII